MKLAYLVFFLGLIGCTDSGSDEPPVIGGETGQCPIERENQLLFEYLHDKYYWNAELPINVNYKDYASSSALLDAVAAPADRFSYIVTKQEYDDRFVNATYYGFGFSTFISRDKQSLLVKFVYADSPSAQGLMKRGDKIVAVENKSIADWLTDIEAGRSTYEDMYGPDQDGIGRTFQWQQSDGTLRSQYLVKTSVKTNSVLHRQVFDSEKGKVGYLVLNAFINPTEQELITAFNDFSAQSVQELVLDLRYNSGGLIRLANQLSSQLAWRLVKDNIFLKYKYNLNYAANNKNLGFSLGEASGSLDLNRIFVLTSSSTCSASELVINSLSPFVNVVLIGAKTCGKPFGMSPVQICDKVISAVNFQTFNALDQGDYSTGLAVECPVTDSVNSDWGSLTDPLLAEAVQYLKTDQCSPKMKALRQLSESSHQSPFWRNGKVGADY
jgi:carboxyl-terminal processing protease